MAQTFFGWHNDEHQHCGLALFTPAEVFFGRVHAVRQAALDAAHALHPERFPNGAPQAALPPASNPHVELGLRIAIRHALFDPLVRARGVEIPNAILIEHLTEVPFAEDDDVIKTLPPHTPEESLAHGVHERSPNGCPKNVRASTLDDAIEVRAERTVVVSNDERGRDAEGCGVANLLRCPLRRRVLGDADMHDALRVDINDEEREDRPEPNVVCRKSHAQTVWLHKNVRQLCPLGGAGLRQSRICRCTVRLATWVPSLSSSPRMRSAPKVDSR